MKLDILIPISIIIVVGCIIFSIPYLDYKAKLACYEAAKTSHQLICK